MPTTPTGVPTQTPTSPTGYPTSGPTEAPSNMPTSEPTTKPSFKPTVSPTIKPTSKPSGYPSIKPTPSPSVSPTIKPTALPTMVSTDLYTDILIKNKGHYTGTIENENFIIDTSDNIVITSGGGQDIYIVYKIASKVTITDFIAKYQKINLEQFHNIHTMNDLINIYNYNSYTNNSQLVLNLSEEKEIKRNNINNHQLSNENFIFYSALHDDSALTDAQIIFISTGALLFTLLGRQIYINFDDIKDYLSKSSRAVPEESFEDILFSNKISQNKLYGYFTNYISKVAQDPINSVENDAIIKQLFSVEQYEPYIAMSRLQNYPALFNQQNIYALFKLFSHSNPRIALEAIGTIKLMINERDDLLSPTIMNIIQIHLNNPSELVVQNTISLLLSIIAKSPTLITENIENKLKEIATQYSYEEINSLINQIERNKLILNQDASVLDLEANIPSQEEEYIDDFLNNFMSELSSDSESDQLFEDLESNSPSDRPIFSLVTKEQLEIHSYSVSFLSLVGDKSSPIDISFILFERKTDSGRLELYKIFIEEDNLISDLESGSDNSFFNYFEGQYIKYNKYELSPDHGYLMNDSLSN